MDDKQNSGNQNSGDENSGNRNSGNWNSGDENSGNQNSGDWNSGNWNSGNWNSGNRNSGDWNSGNRNSGNQNSGDCNGGSRNSGNWNSGDWNSGDWNNGDWNSGNRNSGFFNSTTPPILIFNRETNIKRGGIDIPFYPLICEWIEETSMTNQEKKDNPKFFITGGYLKRHDFKDACKKEWSKMSKENKNTIKSLPNFDEVVFYDITGIDLKCDIDKKKKTMIKEAEKLMLAGQELLKKAKEIF